MIDRIIGYDDYGIAIYTSDVCPFSDYIGYEDLQTGEIILYN